MKFIKEAGKRLETRLNSYKIGRFAIDFSKILYRKTEETNFSYSSSYLAYNLLLSLIPMVIFITQVLSFALKDWALDGVGFLPQSTNEILKPVLETIFAVKSSSLSYLALFSWIWLGSNGFNSLLVNLNNIFGINKNKSFIFNRFFSILYLFIFTLIYLVLLVFMVFNGKIIEFAADKIGAGVFINKVYNFFVSGYTSLIPFFMMLVLFYFMYMLAFSSDRQNRFPKKESFIGAGLSSLAIILLTHLYAYIQNGSNMNIYYGTLAGILAFLTWILLICRIILLGACISASLIELKKCKY